MRHSAYGRFLFSVTWCCLIGFSTGPSALASQQVYVEFTVDSSAFRSADALRPADTLSSADRALIAESFAAIADSVFPILEWTVMKPERRRSFETLDTMKTSDIVRAHLRVTLFDGGMSVDRRSMMLVYSFKLDVDQPGDLVELENLHLAIRDQYFVRQDSATWAAQLREDLPRAFRHGFIPSLDVGKPWAVFTPEPDSVDGLSVSNGERVEQTAFYDAFERAVVRRVPITTSARLGPVDAGPQRVLRVDDAVFKEAAFGPLTYLVVQRYDNDPFGVVRLNTTPVPSGDALQEGQVHINRLCVFGPDQWGKYLLGEFDLQPPEPYDPAGYLNEGTATVFVGGYLKPTDGQSILGPCIGGNE